MIGLWISRQASAVFGLVAVGLGLPLLYYGLLNIGGAVHELEQPLRQQEFGFLTTGLSPHYRSTW